MAPKYLSITEFFDAPEVLEAEVTPIPAKTDPPYQVVESMPKSTDKVYSIDSTNKFIGVYVGPIGFERLIGVIGGGRPSDQVMFISEGTRVSLRSMGVAITRGSLCCQFITNPTEV